MADESEVNKRKSLRPEALWAIALLAPFALAVILQWPLNESRTLSRFFSHPPFFLKSAILFFSVLAPSFLLLALSAEGPVRVKRVAIIALLTPLYLPVLWLFSLYSACMIFNRCV